MPTGVTEGDFETGDGMESWFLIGVGGCGGNCIDAILGRANALRKKDHPLEGLWEQALSGVSVANSSRPEILQTYYAQEYREPSAEKVATQSKFGPKDIHGAGGVYGRGKEVAEVSFEQNAPVFGDENDSAPNNLERLRNTSAVMLIHSVIKGTGAGATPVIAQELAKEIRHNSTDSLAVRPSLFSTTILPIRDDGDSRRLNGLLGVSTLARQVDGIFLVDNGRLDAVNDGVPSQIDGLDGYPAHDYKDANQTLVSFLETIISSTAWEMNNPIGGDAFDPMDGYRPPNRLAPESLDEQAMLIAPGIGQVQMDSDVFDEEQLRILLHKTLHDNQLVQFDPSTAWGGFFVFVSPEDSATAVQEVMNTSVNHILREEQFLDVDSEEDVPIQTHSYNLVVPESETVSLMAGLWNPELPALEEWKVWADDAREADIASADQLNQNWAEIESLFSLLGRDRLRQQLE